MKKSGIELIAAERWEQLHKHGRSRANDQIQNDSQQLRVAARGLLTYNPMSEMSSLSLKPRGWDSHIWDKMCKRLYAERLIIAGALIAAELDRINGIEDDYERKWDLDEYLEAVETQTIDFGDAGSEEMALIGDVESALMRLARDKNLENDDLRRSLSLMSKHPDLNDMEQELIHDFRKSRLDQINTGDFITKWLPYIEG